jgi:hypothetical protein
MGKASSNKKVARAAHTGGGRTARGRRPWLYYGAIALAVLVGVGLVYKSRDDRIQELAAGTEIPPRLADPSKNQPFDHWHEAYGFYLCDHWAKDLPDNAIKGGIHTHADGLIHVEPQTVDDAGPNATVGRFLDLADVTVTETEIKDIPGEKTYKNGDKCGDKEGEVQVYVNEKLRAGDPNKIKITNDGHLVMAFVPKDTKIPDLPSIKNLSSPNANEPTSGSQSSNPLDLSTATAPPTTTTTAVPGPTTAPTTTPKK